jgi:O-antigen/teichoic acid export membrane protein
MLVRDELVQAEQRPRPSLVQGGAAVLIASITSTAMNFAFQLALGRWLGPEEFGQWSAAFSLVAFTGLVAAALQTAVARSEALRPWTGAPPRSWRALATDPFLARVLAGAAALAAALAVASPGIGRIASIDTDLAIGVAVLGPGAALCSVAFGVLQGSRRFAALALVNVVLAAGKLAIAAAALAAGLDSSVILALLGVLTVAAALGGIWWGARAPIDDPRTVVRDVGRALGALGVVAVVAVADIPLARYWLDPTTAGRYAAASTLARAVLLVPAVIVAIALPELARHGRGTDRRERTVLAYAAALTVAGALAVCGVSALASPLLLPHLLGPAYASAAPLVWQLGLATIPFALAGLGVQFLLARNGSWWILWLPLAPLAQVVWLIFAHERPTDVVWSCLAASGLLLAITAVAIVRESRRP